MAKIKKPQAYSEDSIRVLEGLEKVRSNATMYMGDLGTPMVYRMVKEAVDNFYDEAQAGRNTGGIVAFSLKENRYVIADFAQGIPVGMKKVGGKSVSTLTVVMTELHAGGKFDDSAYKTSSGTHGVGISATNALSKEFRVWTRREGSWYFQEFSCGVALADVKKLSDDKALLKRCGFLKPYRKRLGTVIEFIPDQSVIAENASRTKKVKNLIEAKLDIKVAGPWLRNLAMLTPGLEITYMHLDKSIEKTFQNKKGLPGIINNIVEKNTLTPLNSRAMFEYSDDYLSMCLLWTTHADDNYFQSFVNSSPTIDHGMHVKGFRDALAEALKPYLPKKKATKSKRSKKPENDFKVEDLFIGLVGVINWRMNSAQFSGQVKDKLVSKVDVQIYEKLVGELKAFFTKHKKLGKEIVARAVAASGVRASLANIMKSMSEVRSSTRSMLPACLTEAPNCSDEDREQYIVEGDSAAGTAKNARNANQEVVSLSGKILNSLRESLPKLLSNERIQDLIACAGADLKSLDPKDKNPHFSVEKLRVGRVILLADADPDGFHITTLLIAFYWRMFPDLIKQGRLYVVDAPLFNAMYKGKHYGGNTAEECLAVMEKDNVPKQLMFRAKGWGEVPEDMLGYIAFDQKTRKLIRITEETCKDKLRFYYQFIAEDASARRRLLGLKGSAGADIPVEESKED